MESRGFVRQTAPNRPLAGHEFGVTRGRFAGERGNINLRDDLKQLKRISFNINRLLEINIQRMPTPT